MKGEVRMNDLGKVIVVVALIAAVGIVIALKSQKAEPTASQEPQAGSFSPESLGSEQIQAKARENLALPKLVDLGAGTCIPCKMMAPILEELKTEFKDKLEIVFIDVRENPDQAKKYRINLIPTQIFYDGAGKELFRHEGFYSREDILGKWTEFGFDFTTKKADAFSRLEPAVADSRPKDKVCYMCDGDINPKTQVSLATDKGDVYLCCPHCYFITYSSLLEKEGADQKASVVDWKTGKKVPVVDAYYLYGMDEQGRPTIKAFAVKTDAESEQEQSQVSIVNWATLRGKEMTHQCGFCDRVVYPEDSAQVIVEEGIKTWGCCPMCALGVAARTGKDIEVLQRDALVGDVVRLKTTNGSISLLEPKTAVAWAGKRKTENGKLVSAGCFKQAFFVNEANLNKWIDKHPSNTGMMITIHEALAAKMKLTPEQIQKACKIGECVPK
jgi:thioredoxin 1